MKKAAFYRGTLFLVPDEFDSFSSFVSDVKQHPMQVVVTLHEIESLVPYFIDEHCEVKTVMISHPDELIEIDVDVLTRQDYDLKLSEKMKEMKLDDQPLHKMRSSLTLDGTFVRAYNSSCYQESIKEFWECFKTKENLLKDGMDELCTQDDTLRMMFQVYCGISYPQIRVYTRKHKNKYMMMVTSLADSLIQILVDAVIHQAPKELLKEWVFTSHLPKKIFQYRPVSKDYDVSRMPCTLVVKKTDFDHLRYDIVFEVEPYENFAFACEENYLYMCSILGENVFHAVVHSFKWESCRKKTGITVEAFDEQIMSSFHPMLLIQLTGHMHQIGLRLKRQKSFLERGFEQHIMTRCVECTDWFVLEKQSTDINMLQMDLNIGFSTLVFTLRDDIEKEVQQKHILLDLMKLLIENTNMEIIDYCISEHRIDVDFMNFDASKMFNVLRKNAPLFEMYECRYDEHTFEGCEHYEISYKMNKKELKFYSLH